MNESCKNKNKLVKDCTMPCQQLLRIPDRRPAIRKWLRSFDTVLCDCDGVLWLHNTAIDGSPAVIRRLQELGKRVILVTNNSTRTRQQFADKAAQLQYDVAAECIVSTAHVAARYLHDRLRPDQRVYVIGSEGITRELDALGVRHCGCGRDDQDQPLQHLVGGEFRRETDIGAVIVGFDEHFSFVKLSKAATYLASGPESCLFVATSIDQRSPIRQAVIPGTGSMLRAVEEVSGRRAVVMGKPSVAVLERLRAEQPNICSERTLMVGDRCNTDILLGKRCGMQTLLVGTGVHGMEDVARWEASDVAEEKGIVPDYFVPALGDLLEFMDDD